jgi:hypothetical protein
MVRDSFAPPEEEIIEGPDPAPMPTISECVKYLDGVLTYFSSLEHDDAPKFIQSLTLAMEFAHSVQFSKRKQKKITDFFTPSAQASSRASTSKN